MIIGLSISSLNLQISSSSPLDCPFTSHLAVALSLCPLSTFASSPAVQPAVARYLYFSTTEITAEHLCNSGTASDSNPMCAVNVILVRTVDEAGINNGEPVTAPVPKRGRKDS